MPTARSAISSRVTVQNPRPRKYTSAAERQKALRERFPTLCVRVEQEQADFMKRIADEQGRTLQDVHLAFIKYANGRGNLWLTQGLKGFAPLPRFEEPKENPMQRKPTPAQIAARERFAEMARSGAFKRNPAKKTVSQKISQLTREGYPQKQAIAIALSEEREGKVKRNPSDYRTTKENPMKRTFTIQFSDKKPVKTIVADNFDDALEMAAGKRFFSASSDSYRRSGDVTTDKFFNVMVKDPDGTTTYKDGRKLIRLKKIRAQVSLFEIPKRNPRASNPIILVSDKPIKTRRKSNPQERSAKVKRSVDSNYRFAVLAKLRPYSMPGQRVAYETVAGFPTKAQAQDYIDALLKSHPKGLTLKIVESFD